MATVTTTPPGDAPPAQRPPGLPQRDTGLLNHVIVDQLHLTDTKPFWLIGGNSFWTLVMVSVWRTWPFALLCLIAGRQFAAWSTAGAVK
jgi:hypothetical protein